MISAPVKNELIDTPTQRIKPASASDSWAGAEAEKAPAPAESAEAVFDVVTARQKVLPQLPQLPKELEGPLLHEAQQARLVEETRNSDPALAQRLADVESEMPEAGADFCGFRLLVELGRGAFARVFLAQQGDLASRLVVLKISPSKDDESQTLAQLQHTNVVPIYSVHRTGKLQALCMFSFGAATLATVLRDLLRKSLPNSGMGLVDTLVNCRSTVRTSGPGTASKPTSRRPFSSGGEASFKEPAPEGVLPPAEIGSEAILDGLKKFSYVEAVLWIASRLADGLAHAHERGILHRDLKPANILLTDEGQPMLLDFNLAQDTKQTNLSAAVIGGTLPYMSPEQIEAYRAETCTLQFNTDLYSLGLILYELLTGRHPFDIPTGPVKQVLEKMIEQRRGPVPEVRRWNNAVSPAVEAIVRKCLQPDPAKRYASARALKEDIDRQLGNLPLRHAPEPSLGERARKWARRHPRLASSTSVAAIAVLLLAGLVGLLVARSNRLARLEAAETFNTFFDDKKTIQFLLTSRSAERAQVEEGLARARSALGRYEVLDNPAWQETSSVRRLGDAEQGKLREAVGELLLLMARSTSVQAEPAKKEEQLRYALQLNALAEACFPEAPAARAVLAQRAELTGLLGQNADAEKLRTQAEKLPLRTARDHYLVATEHALQGRYREALPLLQKATDLEPQSFWAWCALGITYDGLSLHADAVAAYSTSIALWPRFPWTYYNRGLAHLRNKDFQRARTDFDQALTLRPDLADAYVNRALAWQGQENYQAALRDLSQALKLGTPHTRVYFMRARVRDKLGDAAGAKEDRALGMREQPTDEQSWVARGLARLPDDSDGALADFDKALALNRQSLPALQNKAHVLSKLGRNEAALEVLNKAVAAFPDFVPARAGRGVILARLGKRQAAHQDAEDCLLRDTKPGTFYQLAGIYALTSVRNAEDRQEAYRLLATALRRGYGFELLEIDRDLDPIREQPEFRRLVAVTRALNATVAQQTEKR